MEKRKRKMGNTVTGPRKEDRGISTQNGAEYLYEALDYVAQGKVKSIIETYPLSEAAKAYERVVEGKARFRAVLTM